MTQVLGLRMVAGISVEDWNLMDPTVALGAIFDGVVAREAHLSKYFSKPGKTHLALTTEGLQVLDYLLPDCATVLETIAGAKREDL